MDLGRSRRVGEGVGNGVFAREWKEADLGALKHKLRWLRKEGASPNSVSHKHPGVGWENTRKNILAAIEKKRIPSPRNEMGCLLKVNPLGLTARASAPSPRERR